MLETGQKVVLPKGKAVFPHLVEPDSFEGSLDYKVSILLDPADPEVAKLIANITETAEDTLAKGVAEMKAKGGKHVAAAKAMNLQLPFAPEYAEDGTETGMILLKAKSKAAGITKKGKPWERKLPIFDSGASGVVKRIPHGTVPIFSGAIIKVEVEVFTYVAVGLKLAGVSFFINAVQLIQASTGGGSDGSGFGCEEGGFEADNEAPQGDDSASFEAQGEEDEDF